MLLADRAYHQGVVDVIVGQAQSDLGGAWSSLLSSEPERVAEGMRRVLPAVAGEYGRLAGSSAVTWYQDVRPAAAPAARFSVVAPARMVDAAGLATWAVTPLFSGDGVGALTRLLSTLGGLVRGFDRATTVAAASGDPAARGWVRRASATACAYCAYMSVMVGPSSAAAEKFHDDCTCTLDIAFEGEDFAEQENGAAWMASFTDARAAILAERRKIPGYHSMKRTTRSKRHPEMQLTTKNIIARARRLTPDLFRDGVRAAA